MAKVDELKKQLEQLKRERDALEKEVRQLKNELPKDLEVEPLEGYPEGFVKMSHPPILAVFENTKHLYARVWTQRVGRGDESQRNVHIELLNDPDPKRELQFGQDIKVFTEWTDYKQVLDEDAYSCRHYRLMTDTEIFTKTLKLEEYCPIEATGLDYDLCAKGVVHQFAQKYKAFVTQ
jgi:hypothetical protein